MSTGSTNHTTCKFVSKRRIDRKDNIAHRRRVSGRHVRRLRASEGSGDETSWIRDKFGDTYKFRNASVQDINEIASIESQGYPPDEAATLDSLQFRQREAPEAFMVAHRHDQDKGGSIEGYVCGTCTDSSKLQHESMSNHVPHGKTLCIHSVCVRDNLKRRGLGSAMLETYLKHMPGALPHVKECRLICKEHLIGFYREAGFQLEGRSDVVHGKDPWYELSYFFDE